MSIQTDVVIIGAGPCGLFPDKPIYDIPALPVVGAQELIDRLMEQIRPFAPQFHLNQTVTEFEQRDDGRFTLVTSTGTTFDTAAGRSSWEARGMGFWATSFST